MILYLHLTLLGLFDALIDYNREQIWDCAQLMDTVSDKNIAEYYPSCLENSKNKVIVPATFDAAETIGSALRISFGLGLWLGFFIHALGIEIYVCQIFILTRRFTDLTG